MAKYKERLITFKQNWWYLNIWFIQLPLVSNVHTYIRKHIFKWPATSPKWLLKDKYLRLDYTFFNLWLVNQKIKSYEIIEIPLKDIKRFWQGRALSLSECHPYKYLLGEEEQFLVYCDKQSRTREQFDHLRVCMKKKGFNQSFMPVLTHDNFLMDGQHRACILLQEYGPDYKIKALKIWFEQVNFTSNFLADSKNKK